jgi:hypothetical protein
MSHTKGPWIVSPPGARGDIAITAESKRGLMKPVAYTAGFFRAERDANARLLAAAPPPKWLIF